MPRRVVSRRRSYLEPFGAVLRDFREAQGLTQADVGYASGHNFNHIGGFERGERNLTIKVLLDILDALGLSLVEFAQAVERERTRAAKR